MIRYTDAKLFRRWPAFAWCAEVGDQHFIVFAGEVVHGCESHDPFIDVGLMNQTSTPPMHSSKPSNPLIAIPV